MPLTQYDWPTFDVRRVPSIRLSPLGSSVLNEPAYYGSYRKEWERTANYFAKKRNGDRLKSLPFRVQVTRVMRPIGTFRYYPTASPDSMVRVNGNLIVDGFVDWSQPMIYSIDHPSVSKSDSKTASSILKKVKDSSVNLAQTFGERKQTARLIGDTAQRIARSISNLRRGNLPGAVNDLIPGASPSAGFQRRYRKNASMGPDKRASVAWLELQYGWKPLLGEVYGSAEQVAKAQNRQYFFRVTSKDTTSDAKETLYHAGYSDAQVVRAYHNFSYENKRSCTYSITNLADRKSVV